MPRSIEVAYSGFIGGPTFALNTTISGNCEDAPRPPRTVKFPSVLSASSHGETAVHGPSDARDARVPAVKLNPVVRREICPHPLTMVFGAPKFCSAKMRNVLLLSAN